MAFTAGRSLIVLAMLSMISPILHAAESPPDLSKAAVDGSSLSLDQVQQMEQALLVSPNNAVMRAQLLGYYYPRQVEFQQPRAVHVLWIIQHEPTDTFSGSTYCRIDPDTDAAGYAKAIALWQQIQAKDPDNTAILRNAASAFAPADDIIAETYLRHGIELQPKNPDWSLRLAILLEARAARSPGDRVKAATEALAHRQQACDLEKNANKRFAYFTEMPRDAILANDYIRAKHLSEQLLSWVGNFRDDPNYGYAIHIGNIVLGRVALHSGDTDSAETYLTAAGDTPGSPQLTSKGPDMSLADELLKRGQRQAARDYLQQCEKFWTSGSSRLKSWIATIDAGGSPDFGAQAIE
jgi:tetratricopeptide (TPR) repeat protein